MNGGDPDHDDDDGSHGGDNSPVLCAGHFAANSTGL